MEKHITKTRLNSILNKIISLDAQGNYQEEIDKFLNNHFEQIIDDDIKLYLSGNKKMKLKLKNKV